MSTHTIKNLGLVPYADAFAAMKAFTEARSAATADEIWLLEHPPVFTQGLGGKAEHILQRGAIPIVPIDRGGQITYHAPGQIVMYLLLDLNRARVGIRALVTLIENSVIALLADQGIAAASRADAPGVYVAGKKIASLGLKIRRGCCYHGVALNVDMDLAPFRWINPCGLRGMEMTQLADLGIALTPAAAGAALAAHFQRLWTAAASPAAVS